GRTGADTTVSSFLFCDPPTTDTYARALHDALPISGGPAGTEPEPHRGYPPAADAAGAAAGAGRRDRGGAGPGGSDHPLSGDRQRSEEHTSELQSRENLVCRLLLEKKNNARQYSEVR